MIRPQVGEHSGVRRLLLAVLEDALTRLSGGNPEGVPPVRLAEQVGEARAWIAARDEAEGLSFETVCAGLGIAAEPLRRAALAGRLHAAARGARRVEARPRLSGQTR